MGLVYCVRIKTPKMHVSRKRERKDGESRVFDSDSLRRLLLVYHGKVEDNSLWPVFSLSQHWEGNAVVVGDQIWSREGKAEDVRVRLSCTGYFATEPHRLSLTHNISYYLIQVISQNTFVLVWSLWYQLLVYAVSAIMWPVSVLLLASDLCVDMVSCWSCFSVLASHTCLNSSLAIDLLNTSDLANQDDYTKSTINWFTEHIWSS